MTRRLAERGLVVGACLLALVSTACTPDTPPSPPPTSAAATPTETAQEREQRLAYEAAEKSYREFRAEVERVYARGGATKPTALMRATAGGQYLASYQEVSEAYHELKHHSKGPLHIIYVHRDGYSPTELVLETCEDGHAVVTYNKRGKRLYNDDIRKIRITVRLVAGAWKVWSGKGEQVSTCE